MDASSSGNNNKSKDSLLEQWKKKKVKDALGSDKSKLKSPILTSEMLNMWTLQNLEPDSPFYQHTEIYKVQGVAVDAQKLQESVLILLNKHELFRYNFIRENEQVKAKIRSEIDDFIVFDLGLAENEKIAYQKTKAFGRLIFDLENDLLFRVGHLKVSSESSWIVLSMHHIIGDRQSLDIITAELFELYTGGSIEEKIDSSFRQYAHIENSDSNFEKDRKFWVDRYSTLPQNLELPFARKRPVQPSYHGSAFTKNLDSNLSKKIINFSSENKTTPYVIILSALSVLINRYSNQSSIAIGVPFSTRHKGNYQNTVGFFNRVLAIKLETDGFSTFTDHLHAVKQSVLSSFSHESFDYKALVKEIKPERLPGVNPLFQIMYIHNKDNTSKVTELPFVVDREVLDLDVAKFDLTLFSFETDEGVSLKLEYSTELFDSIYMERMLDHLEIILEQATGQNDLKIQEYEFISKPEKRLLKTWNQTKQELPKIKTIHEAIENIGQSLPNKIACSDSQGSLTYQELNLKADALARKILEIQPENKIIGVYQKRDIEFIVSILAILKAGYAYLPLDPTYPEDRIQFMVRDSGTELLITNLADQIKGVKSISLKEVDYNDKSKSTPLIQESDGAYMIYTSGSSGMPKGVLVSHKNLITSTFARNHFYPVQPSVFFLLSPFSFDSSVAGIFWTLTSGGNLFIPESKIEQDPELLGKLINQEHVSHILLLPSLYEALLATISAEKLHSLKAVIVAGESCPYQLVETHHRLLPECKVYNEYGPTEATVWCVATSLEVNPDRSVPIGKPIPNYEVFLLNEQMKQVPVGVRGNLYIAGDGVTIGYYNRMDLTAQKFVKHEDRIVYKTGDIAQFDNTGNLFFYGRDDSQVKIRGHRIELDEIKDIIITSGLVKAAYVSLYTESNSSKKLAAHIVSDDHFSEQKLKTYLNQKMPAYMVPKHVIILDSLPLLPNGKVDARSLPMPSSSATSNNSGKNLPLNQIQDDLAQIWCEILNLDVVGIDDNFFSLGGDSISSILMVSKARDKQIFLKPGQIFQDQTIQELESTLKKEQGDYSLERPIEVCYEEEITPLQSAFLINRLSNKQDQGLLHLIFFLQGKIVPDQFRKALTITAERHPALRTIFYEKDGVFFQKIVKDLQIDFLYNESNYSKEIDINKHSSRFILNKKGQNEYELVWICHHINLDGWSCGEIIKDLLISYSGETQNELTYNYPTYLSWKRKRSIKKESFFWRNYLSNVENLTLIDPQKANLKYDFQQLEVKISTKRQDKISNFCQEHKLAQSFFFQMVWSLVLASLFDSRKIVYGLTVSGRSLSFPNINQIAGLFMNMVPEIAELPANTKFIDWLQNGQKSSAKKRSFDHSSNEEIKEWANWNPNQPLFDALLIYGNFLSENTSVGDINILDFKGGFTSRYPLSLRIKPSEDTQLFWQYDSNILSEEKMRLLGNSFLKLIDTVLLEKDLIIDDLLKEHAGLKEFNPVNRLINHNKQEILNNTDLSYVEIEKAIIDNWNLILEKEVTPDSNFFKLGGTSLNAVESLSKLSKICSQNISPSVMINYNTPQKLAQYLLGHFNKTVESEMLVPMKTSGDLKPLFCFHAGGSQVLFYSDFTRSIDRRIPVYSIQPPDITKSPSFPKSIEELATLYLQEMRKIQSSGPYQILGICFSNALLVEISHQLNESNVKNNKIFVIDSAPSMNSISPESRRNSKLSKALYLLRNRKYKDIFNRILGRRKTDEELISETFNTEQKNLVTTIKMLNDLYINFKWKKITDHVHLIRSSQFNQDPKKEFHVKVWNELTNNNMESYTVNGEHLTIFDGDSAQELASTVNQILYLSESKNS